MTYQQLLQQLLELQKSGVDLDSFDVTFYVTDTQEFYPVSFFFVERESDVLDEGTPVLAV